MLETSLKHQQGDTKIICGEHLLRDGAVAKACLALAHQVVVVSDSHVAKLYGDPLINQLRSMGKTTHRVVFAAGEASKNRDTKAMIEDQMLNLGCTRDTLMVSVGGGVVSDLAGFVASSYCRGIPTLYVPTTLLAMVDAAVGGKTGVNTAHGKNLIGHFHQPQSVWCDVATLKTVSNDGLNDGWAETIKHALIRDPHLFYALEQWLEHNQPVQTHNALAWADWVHRSCQIKCDVVMMDEYESLGVRQWLNFGHTVAHAIERTLDYSISHGQAVLVGLWVESFLSMKQGYLSPSSFEKISALLDKLKYSKPLVLPEALLPQLVASMHLDKKATQGQPRFVLLDAIGSARKDQGHYSFAIDENQVMEAIRGWSNAHT